jgi:gliding motility-associated-like protein
MTESNVSEHKDIIEPDKSNVDAEKNYLERKNNNTIPIQPSGNFNISSVEGCSPFTISLQPEEISDSIVYYWNFGNGDFSNEIKPDYTYTKEGKYTISLTVKYFHSEKQLTMFYPQKVVVFSSPMADFSWSSDEPEYRFKSDCQDCDNIWNIDEELYFGETVNLRFELEKTYKISLVSENIYGCKDTIVKNIENTNEFKIHIPTGFTPDNDNVNDLFGPVIYNIGDRKYLLSIYSGKGQLVFQSNDINYQWNGKIMNSQQNADPGIYFWEIFLNSESGDSVKKAGHVTLIR